MSLCIMAIIKIVQRITIKRQWQRKPKRCPNCRPNLYFYNFFCLMNSVAPACPTRRTCGGCVFLSLPVSAVEGIKSAPSVCQPVCVSIAGCIAKHTDQDGTKKEACKCFSTYIMYKYKC